MRQKHLRAWGVVALLAAAPGSGWGNTDLLDALKAGDAALVDSILRSPGVDIEVKDAEGSTAFHWAAYLEDLESAVRLARMGADATAQNRYGISPLFYACTNGNAAMVEVLLEAGADPNTAVSEGETALMTAARSGSVRAVEALIRAGADVNSHEAWRGQTALMWAAAEGHADVVQSLLDGGADFRMRSPGGFTAFLFAARNGHIDTVRVLLASGVDVNDALPSSEAVRPVGGNRPVEPPLGGASALLLAVGSAHYEMANLLLEAGADPNAAGPGWTALHLLTWVRKPGLGENRPAPRGSGSMNGLELIRALAAHGADLDAQMTAYPPVRTWLNTIGATPFLMAARTADVEMMRMLADLGADPLLPNEDNSTPLMVAAGLGTQSPGEDPGTEAEVLEAVRFALELGNDINAVDNNGDTAMHGPGYKHLPAVVHFLAANGAKAEVWNRPGKEGATPLELADGITRGINFRFSPGTAVAMREVMNSSKLPR